MAFPQVFPVQHFAEEDGLSHGNIYRIMQDSRGFLWLGTEDGVSLYDGFRFENLNFQGNFSMTGIMGIEEMPGDRKVIFTYRNGLFIIHHDSIAPVQVENLGNGMSLIRGVYFRGELLVTNTTGNVFILQGCRFKQLIFSNDGWDTCYRMVKAGNELYWVTSNGIARYKNGHLEHMLTGLVHEKVYSLAFDTDGSLWAGLQNKVIRIKKGDIMEEYQTGDITEISDLTIDRAHQVWISSPKAGVLLLGNNKIRNITGLLHLQNILINAIFNDRDGNIWIATHGSGLFCVNSTEINIYPVQNGVINNYATSVSAHGHAVYISSIGTVCKIEKGRAEPVPLKSLRPNDFVYFAAVNAERLYAGAPKGLIVAHTGGHQKEKILCEGGAVSFLEDKKGKLWVGRFGELGYLENGIYKKVPPDRFFNNNKRVISISNAQNDGILVGTDSGLVAYDGKKFTYLFTGNTRSQNRVDAALQDSRGRIWVATEGGLYLLDNGKNIFFDTRNGLSNNKCSSLAEDSEGNIWIGTLSGLNKFNGHEFEKLDSRSGLSSSAILSLCFDKDQNLWAGTMNGVTCIKKGFEGAEAPQPKLYITKAQAGGNAFYFPDSLNLSYKDRALTISYSALEFPRSDKVEYRYKILPVSNSWQPTAAHAIEMPALASGDYTLEIMARHTGNRWPASPAVLHIHIRAPYWASSWFIIFMAGLGLFGGYRVLRGWIVKKEKKKREKTILQNKMLHLRQQALNAMINPHFVFNCLNAIQSFIYSNNKEQANLFLSGFSKLIRMTLEHGQDVFINLDKEIERLDLYLTIEQLRFEDKLSYFFEIDPSLNTRDIVIPNMIVQPYVENAVKHGIVPKKGGGCIWLKIKKSEGQELIIIIEDNGIGFQNKKNTEPHHSMGMELTGERLLALHKIHNRPYKVEISDLKDTEGQSTGTSVKLTMALDVKISPEAFAEI